MLGRKGEEELLLALREPAAGMSVAAPDGELTAAELASAGAATAQALGDQGAVLLWSSARTATVVGLVGALAAGKPVIPLNPKSGPREVEHIVADVKPTTVLAAADEQLPEQLAAVPRTVVDPAARGGSLPAVPADGEAALIMYTSGTTGPPKGVVISRAAIAANLDALAEIWAWTDADVLTHALPLFHVHGLVLGTLGPLRLGSTLRHMGSFDPERTCEAIEAGATMLFAVPTMYHRLAELVENDPARARQLAGARLLVSGSAPLSAADHERIARCCGQAIVERYGMTEALMITSTVAGATAAGYVGLPLPGVELKVLDDEQAEVPHDDTSIGKVLVRGPSLMTGYFGLPEATAAALPDGYLHTGDVGTVSPDGMLRLVGRESVDLIKSGGYRIGAGEIEATLVSHAGVAEAAVAGLPDPDLGQRIVAWVVPAEGAEVPGEELIQFVADELTPHKRPREVHFVPALPRNAMGKVQKQRLIHD